MYPCQLLLVCLTETYVFLFKPSAIMSQTCDVFVCSWARMAKGLSPWYDINFVASSHLRDWMLAGGVPEDKVKVCDGSRGVIAYC